MSFSSVCLYFLVVFQVSFSSSKSSSSKSSGQDVYLLCGSQTGLLFIFGGPSEEIHNQSFRGIRPQKKHSFICLSPRREREREKERKKETHHAHLTKRSSSTLARGNTDESGGAATGGRVSTEGSLVFQKRTIIPVDDDTSGHSRRVVDARLLVRFERARVGRDANERRLR